MALHFLETGKDAAAAQARNLLRQACNLLGKAYNLHPWQEEAWWGSLAFGPALSSFLAADGTLLWSRISPLNLVRLFLISRRD